MATPKIAKPGAPALDILKDTLQRSDRDRIRNRIRMELSVAKARWLLEMLSAEVRKIDIDSPDFKETYDLYIGIKRQIDLITSQKKPVGSES